MKSIFIFLIISLQLFAFESIEILNPNITIKKSGFFITDIKFTPHEAKKKFDNGEFQQFSKNIYGNDLDSKDYWYAFEVVVEDEKNSYFIDNIDPAVLESSLYVFRDGEIIREEKGGYLLSSSQKHIDSKSIRFALESTTTPTIYLIKSKSVYPRFSGFAFGDSWELESFHSSDYVFYILLSGSIFTILIYNLFIYLSTKNKSYFYYVLYLFLFWMSGSLARGYDYLLADYITNYAEFQPLLFMATLQIYYFGLAIFTEKFLMLKEKHPKLQKAVRIVFYLNGIFIFLVALNIPILNILSQFFSASLNTSLLIAAGYSFKKGHKPALYYLLATGGMLVMMYVYIAMTKGVFAYNIYTANLMLFSVWWDAVLLSFALAYSIKILQEEKERQSLLLTASARNAAVGEFAGNIAHQWRQPLTSLGILVAKLESALMFENRVESGKLREFIKSSNSTIEHLSSAIDTFRGFFIQEENRKVFNTKEQIERSIAFVKDSMDEAKIEIFLDAKDGLFLEGSPNAFAQVILVLLSNAKDACMRSNNYYKTIYISIKARENEVIISIEDNGEGIKIKPIEKIFEPYITTKSLNGVGIGLFIAKNIIEQRFDGRIEARNCKNGACFEIKI